MPRSRITGRRLADATARLLFSTIATVAWAAATESIASAQSPPSDRLHGVVVDQTELPIPGAMVQVIRDDGTVSSLITSANGTFDVPDVSPSDTVEVSLEGFETIRVPAARAARIVLEIARANVSTTVHASSLASSGAAMERVGSTLTSREMLRMPVPHPRALESLPRLPSVVRGRDGALHIDGTPPEQSMLLVDGFDLTDPATGVTAIDLPVEAVKGVAVIRDPMSATFGQVLGSLASIETIAGPDNFTMGVQGFIPRPRLSELGFGRIEAFFPRVYVAGRAGKARYFAAQELDYERIVVPGVTDHTGSPSIGAVSATTFGRLDVELTSRHALTFETVFVPGHRENIGLSPLQDQSAAPSAHTQDLFGGVIDRWLLGTTDVVTVRVGVLTHDTTLTSPNAGVARLTPYGWRDNWFSNVDHWAVRQSAVLEWDHSGIVGWGTHVLSSSIDLRHRSMDLAVANNPIRIEDVAGRTVRSIQFATRTQEQVQDWSSAALVRDLWDINAKLQVDAGVRVDWQQSSGETAPSPRLAVRYHFGSPGTTTLKGGIGRFVGRTPLAALAFDSYPTRQNTFYDAGTGEVEKIFTETFALRRLRMPRADSVVVEIERQVGAFDTQLGFRQRLGSMLPTVDVPADGGVVTLAATGTSTFRELQAAARRSWGEAGQAFVSYVHTFSRAELNDFGSMYANADAPVLNPGGLAPATDEVPHRLIAWATIPLPRRIMMSPAIDWRTGFPYSNVSATRQYVGAPNSQRFPNFFSADVTVYKTFDISHHGVDLGLQVFNITSHRNPRDVYAVVGTPGPQFTNSLGRTFGGYMVVRWNSADTKSKTDAL